MTKNISTLITYLSLLQETFKLKEQEGMNTRYVDVDIELPENFIIYEHWYGSVDQFHTVEVPAKDLPKRIKVARDHLRYLKKRRNGSKYGEWAR